MIIKCFVGCRTQQQEALTHPPTNPPIYTYTRTGRSTEYIRLNRPPTYIHTYPQTHRESDDVDVALDNVSGQAFAEALNEHLRAQGLETRSVGVIQVRLRSYVYMYRSVVHMCRYILIMTPTIPRRAHTGEPRPVETPGDGARAGAGAVGGLHQSQDGDLHGGVPHPHGGLRDGGGGGGGGWMCGYGRACGWWMWCGLGVSRCLLLRKQCAQDAFRRDFTINALFYNLHTGHVEDYTGKVR